MERQKQIQRRNEEINMPWKDKSKYKSEAYREYIREAGIRETRQKEMLRFTREKSDGGNSILN